MPYAFVTLLTLPSVGLGDALKQELSVIQSKALQGDPYYQGTLGLFYKYGERGLSIDLGEAERWSKLAAEKDGGIGLAVLASIELERGKTERGQFLYDEAYLHSSLRVLAKAKDPIAQFCIGLMEMDNPPRNIHKGIRSLERAADQGLATAQATLGMIYFTGIGVPRDPEEAIKWCSQAARQKLPLGMFYLGMAYSAGDGLRKNNDFSNRWIGTAAERGLMMAQLTLGMKLALGDGIERNLDLGVQWLRQAANRGSAQAQLQLRRFENLLVRSPSRKSSIDAMQRQSIAQLAEEASFPSSAESSDTKVGESPKIVVAPPSSEILLLRKNGLNQYKLQHFSEAIKNFTEASEANDPIALRYLGIMHFLGQGVQVNYPKAIEWLSRAKSHGDNEADRYLKIAKTFSQ
jgi:TPR repeat protein